MSITLVRICCPLCGSSPLVTHARASAIEAATAGETTEIGSTEGESAVGEAETPTRSRQSNKPGREM